MCATDHTFDITSQFIGSKRTYISKPCVCSIIVCNFDSFSFPVGLYRDNFNSDHILNRSLLFGYDILLHMLTCYSICCSENYDVISRKSPCVNTVVNTCFMLAYSAYLHALDMLQYNSTISTDSYITPRVLR